MDSKIKEDIKAVLKELITILTHKNEGDALKVKELSNHVIHNAALFQDEDSISVTVLVYALSKLMEQGVVREYMEFRKPIETAYKFLNRNDVERFRRRLRKIFALVSSKDAKLRLYVEDVLNHSQVRRGCKICEHGVSCAKSAELLNISQWDLMQYLGKTLLADELKSSDVRSRLRFARKLFT